MPPKAPLRDTRNIMFAFEVTEIQDQGHGKVSLAPSTEIKDFVTIFPTGRYVWHNGVIKVLPAGWDAVFKRDPVEVVTVMSTSQGIAMAILTDMTQDDVGDVWCKLGFQDPVKLPNGLQMAKIGYAAVAHDWLQNDYTQTTWVPLLPPTLRAQGETTPEQTSQPLVGSLALVLALAACSGVPGQTSNTLTRGFLRADDGRRYWRRTQTYQRPSNTGVVVRLYIINTPVDKVGSSLNDLERLKGGRGSCPIFNC